MQLMEERMGESEMEVKCTPFKNWNRYGDLT